MLDPFPAGWNGNGIERRLDENSSLESPATITLPFTNARCVTVSSRGLLPLPWPGLESGGSGKLNIECFTLSRETSVILPAASARRITGVASGPRPRDTEMYAFLERGLTTTSLIII